MSSSNDPTRFTVADARRLVFRSRSFFIGTWSIFAILGLSFILLGGPVWPSIGSSLVASVMVSFAQLWLEQIRGGEQLRSEELSRAGVRAVYNRRDLEDYDSHLISFKEIDVTGYTLRSFIESNEGKLRKRLAEGSTFKIRMLMVDPHSEFARVMEREENQHEGSYVASLQTMLEKLNGLSKVVELRTISRSLSMMIYRIDDVLYTGPYPFCIPSRTAFTFKFDKGGWLFERQCLDFESMWREAKPVNISGQE
jgi:hypothetical protein